MNEKNVWADFRSAGGWDDLRPSHRWDAGDIERDKFRVLRCSAKPFAIQTCADLHPHRDCNGTGSLRGSPCMGCGGSGVGPIKAGSHDYCPRCHKSGVDDDPRLIVKPGEMPRREPRPPAEPLLKPRLTKEEAQALAKAERAEARAKKQAVKVKAKARAKERAKAAKAKAKTDAKAAKAKSKAKEKKAAERAAEKARPKYIAPWKQAPPA